MEVLFRMQQKLLRLILNIHKSILLAGLVWLTEQLEDYLDDDYLVINFLDSSWKGEINRWQSKPYPGFPGHIAEIKAVIISIFNGRG
jgi:hypothetical protein